MAMLTWDGGSEGKFIATGNAFGKPYIASYIRARAGVGVKLLPSGQCVTRTPRVQFDTGFGFPVES